MPPMPWRLARHCPLTPARPRRLSACAYALLATFSAGRRTIAAFRSKLACMCIQNCGVVLKSCASRSAVSAVTPRLPRTSSLRRTVDIPGSAPRRPASSRAASETPRGGFRGRIRDAKCGSLGEQVASVGKHSRSAVLVVSHTVDPRGYRVAPATCRLAPRLQCLWPSGHVDNFRRVFARGQVKNAVHLMA